MVQRIPEKKAPKRVGNRYLPFLLLGLAGVLYSGLPPFLEKGPDGSYILSKQRQKDFEEKPLRSENVEVYRLLAGNAGYFNCLKCNDGLAQVFLNTGEVWKYGISRNGRSRYNEQFYAANNVVYQTIATTDILSVEQLEMELIIGYPLLPECQKRMKLQKVFLKKTSWKCSR